MDVVRHRQHTTHVSIQVGKPFVEVLALKHCGFDAGDGDLVGLFVVVGITVFDGDGAFASTAIAGSTTDDG